MPASVVDASVIAAWCFREPRADEAFALIKDSELYAPLLLAFELTSIAYKKASAYPEQANVLEEALRTALALPIHWTMVEHLAVLHLAMDTRLTTYDACYLHVARQTGLPLITFDKDLKAASRVS